MIAQNGTQTVIKTDHGLTIAGTRLTVSHVMDYLNADWPPQLIQDWLNLTDKQISDVLAYIDVHRDEVESDYQEAVQLSDDSRQYWKKYNHARSRLPEVQRDSDQEKLFAKLEAWKKRRNIA